MSSETKSQVWRLVISTTFRNKKSLAKYFIDRKLKTSGFLIFEIKRDKIGQNFLKDRFSVTSDPMDMIFGVFRD